MKIKAIASSSKGNSYIVELFGEILLLEAGVSLSKLRKASGFIVSSAVGCLISHGHL